MLTVIDSDSDIFLSIPSILICWLKSGFVIYCFYYFVWPTDRPKCYLFLAVLFMIICLVFVIQFFLLVMFKVYNNFVFAFVDCWPPLKEVLYRTIKKTVRSVGNVNHESSPIANYNVKTIYISPTMVCVYIRDSLDIYYLYFSVSLFIYKLTFIPSSTYYLCIYQLYFSGINLILFLNNLLPIIHFLYQYFPMQLMVHQNDVHHEQNKAIIINKSNSS